MLIRKRSIFFVAGLMFCVLGVAFGVQRNPVKPVIEKYDITLVKAIEMPIFYVKTDKKAVALTFDISWGDKTPEKVLDVLAKYNQKATFFLSGPWAKHYKDIVTRIVQDGHEIASHGQEHINLSKESKETILDNIKSAHDILVNTSKTSPRYFRPPNGDYDDLVILAARELGYETIIWAVDSVDWMNPGVTYIVERISKLVFPGAILLFHASDSAKQTHEALPMVIENLRSAGYQVVSLGELMTMGKPARDDPRGRPISEITGN